MNCHTERNEDESGHDLATCTEYHFAKPCTVFSTSLDAGVSLQVLRKGDLTIERYCQHPNAISLTFSEPRKRKLWRRVQTGIRGAVPPFFLVVADVQSAIFTRSGINLRGLNARPLDVAKLAEYYDEVSDDISARFEVLFDWRWHRHALSYE